MLSICPRLRWLKCRLLRLITLRTFLVLIICCIIVEIARGLPVHQRKSEDILRDNNVYLQNVQGAVAERLERVGAGQKEPKINQKQNRKLNNKSKKTDGDKLGLDKLELDKVGRWKSEQAPEDEYHRFPEPKQQLLPVVDAYQNRISSRNMPFQSIKTKKPYNESFYENRVIHFDLKGAAPKMTYLKEVLKLIKANGATGILLEWEDTFPFNGILEANRNSDAYTVDEVRDLLKMANSLQLDVIPLVQTFGHLEWILKVEKFRQHRQNDMFPQVICLSDGDGVAVVMEAIRQVIQIHLPYGIRYFHIGADEAFQYGECAKDREWLRKNQRKSKEHLAAMHLAKIANYVKTLVPGVRVLAWHDMIQTFDSVLIRQYGLDRYLEIVVWDYSETLQQQSEFTWRSLAERFPIVWGSSAYKGANQPSSQYLDLMHYVRNNKAWINHRKMFGPLFRTFRGLILTGWQRYDHFAVLCELLPVGLPSAIVNLLIAKAAPDHSETVLDTASRALNCTSKISPDYMASLRTCRFPGAKLFHAIHSSLHDRIEMVETDVFENHQVKGWLNRFSVRHNYTQLWYLVQLESAIQMHFEGMLETTKLIRKAMGSIFLENTIDEWIYEYVDPTTERLEALLKQISQLKGRRTFPVRNFDIKRQIKQEL